MVHTKISQKKKKIKDFSRTSDTFSRTISPLHLNCFVLSAKVVEESNKSVSCLSLTLMTALFLCFALYSTFIHGQKINSGTIAQLTQRFLFILFASWDPVFVVMVQFQNDALTSWHCFDTNYLPGAWVKKLTLFWYKLFTSWHCFFLLFWYKLFYFLTLFWCNNYFTSWKLPKTHWEHCFPPLRKREFRVYYFIGIVFTLISLFCKKIYKAG